LNRKARLAGDPVPYKSMPGYESELYTWTINLTPARAALYARLTSAACAIERFRLENGTLPPVLDILVPAYLAEVPRDPYGGEPMLYRIEEDAFAVYSVYQDFEDNGGNAEAFDHYHGTDLVLRIRHAAG
jgi:hypothetical protein